MLLATDLGTERADAGLLEVHEAVADAENDVRGHEIVDAGAESEDARRILHAMLDSAARTLKTNLFLPKRYGLAMRLDPSLIERPDLTDVPYGLFFVHGQGFDGFHLRFRDIARGGVRVVRPATPQALSREIDRLYDEVYGLAHAQQLKNKDIPEGGAKAVIVSNPDITVKATGYQWKWGYDYLQGEGEGVDPDTGVRKLNDNLVSHMHLENAVLFPRFELSAAPAGT